MILLSKILLRYTYNVGWVIMLMVAICDFIQGDVPWSDTLIIIHTYIARISPNAWQ